MEKYQKGKIYKLWSPSCSEVYIGSTTSPLIKRLWEHRSDLGCFLKGKKNYRTSFEIIKYQDAKIELIELYPCNSRKELDSREGFFIKNTKCINSTIAGRNKAQYYQDNKILICEKKRDYHNKNKERINKRRRELYKLRIIPSSRINETSVCIS
jgi:hypothetical protein